MPTYNRKPKTSTTCTKANPKIAPRTSQTQLSQAEVDVLLDTYVAPISTIQNDTLGAAARRVKMATRFCRRTATIHDDTQAMGRREANYALPYETRNQMFLHRLERMFGMELGRGMGPKPPKVRILISYCMLGRQLDILFLVASSYKWGSHR